MKANTQMKEHREKAGFPSTIFAERPRSSAGPEGQPDAGQSLVLDCGMVHDVEALEESAFRLPSVG